MNGILKTLSTMSKAYAFSKIMVKTSMTPPEILLFKDVYKNCSKYIEKRALVYAKSIFAK